MPPRANLSREEPDAGIPHVRVCEGWGRQRPHLLGIDVEARQIDVIVVYKVDRLTRSLADFAKLVETFDARGTENIDWQLGGLVSGFLTGATRSFKERMQQAARSQSLPAPFKQVGCPSRMRQFAPRQ